MANRRMFSKDVTNADEFLDMPLSSQALYFHLGMNADDDGFVQPKSIMRLVQAKDDDLKVLRSKGFIIPFKESVIVITHWKMMNQIQPSRHVSTIYQEHLKVLGLTEGKYEMSTDCQQIVDKTSTQYSIGKVSRVKNSKVNLSNLSVAEKSEFPINEIIKLFEVVNPSYEKFYANTTQRSALERLLKKHGEPNVRGLIKYLPILNEDKYAKGKSITPLELENNLAHIHSHYKQKVNISSILKI